jgi:hypothetical protein
MNSRTQASKGAYIIICSMERNACSNRREKKAFAIVAGVAAALCALRCPSVDAQLPAPRIEITDPWVRPDERLRVWVACARGTGAGDLQSPVIRYTTLDAQPGARWWFAAPAIVKDVRPGPYTLRARCTPGSGASYAVGTAAFRVARGPEPWIAVSTTAMSITGNARFGAASISFAAGGRLATRYLRDVSGSVSVLGSGGGDTHASLYRVLSHADLQLRSGNRLCGATPAYLSVLRTRSGAESDIILTVYTGASAPAGAPSDKVCASYTYAPSTP